tara:strand:+ start:3236 stop:3583 length:348 start_codon:yes stop_codon:yes gene_type:complete
MGCAKQGAKQNGGYSCEYPKNMGEIITGKSNNLHFADLTPKSTQNYNPIQLKQQGGGLINFDGMGTGKLIDFGLSNTLTNARSVANSLSNLKSTWDADRHVSSADPVDFGKMDNT